MGELSTSLDVWIIARFWFTVPLQHSEALADQELALGFVEALRAEVEKATGETDPYRAEKDEILTDTLAFSRSVILALEFSSALESRECLSSASVT